jgi:YdaS antitoxin of YdaST toxin-antitoxin system
MSDAPRDNLYGYSLVIQAVRSKIGPDESPQTWLATQLGTSRQACHFWANSDGIPAKHVPAVSQLTGLSAIEIRPEDVATMIPGSVFDEIAKQATAKRTTFTARLVAVLRLGLKSA